MVTGAADRFTGCLSIDQLRALWRSENPPTSWDELSGSYPATELRPIGWKPDSASHQLLAEALFGSGDAQTRNDYEVVADGDAVLVSVAASPGAIGYLPLGDYRPGMGVRPIAIDDGEGCVAPSARTIGDGSYAPLSRRLYLDVKRSSLRRPEVRSFVRRYLRSVGRLSRAAGLVATAPSHRVYRKFTRP